MIIIRINFVFLILPIFLILAYSCKKEIGPPSLTTSEITDISYTSATSGGEVIIDGGAPILAEGVCWTTPSDPTTASIKTNVNSGSVFTSSISNLIPNTLYYIKAYATNSAGTGFGNQLSFTTSKLDVPEIITTDITEITFNTVVSGGNITDEKGESVIARGVCWGYNMNPTIENSKTIDGTGSGSFISNLTSLTGNTPYYLRAYATNRVGTGYGNEIVFTLWINRPGPKVNDIDGNTYNSVIIGNQVWMAKNLKTTRYNDGSSIQLISNGTEWGSLSTPAYSWYNNSASNYGSTYGALYNWFAVNTGKLCPAGWHVPTFDEGKQLFDYLGGKAQAGGNIKITGTTYWQSPNEGASNKSGFSALPAGYRSMGNGSFSSINTSAYWWMADELYPDGAWYIGVVYHSGGISLGRFSSKTYGLSVRCIQN